MTGSSPAAGRIGSIDVIRGAVMVLMAVDHVRVYAGVPPGGPEPAVFFTRWITHFCAPAFFFLAGTSAFLFGQRGDKGTLSRFLVVRGLILVLLELTIIRLSWTFNFDYANYLLAGVIWSLGWCMVLLAILVRLPLGVVAAFGIAVVAGHNLIDPHFREWAEAARTSPLGWLWQILYFGGGFRLFGSGPPLIILYSLVPWIGVMAAGYAFGWVMLREPAKRDRLCLAIGLGATALFLVLRGFNLYGNRFPWSATGPEMPALLSFLNSSKYPASLLFLLMTLGPTIALIPLIERARGAVARWLTVFGRVPMFYYLLHIPLIHLVAVLISLVRTPGDTGWLFTNHPMMPPEVPDGYRWSLGLLYGVTVVVVVILYFPCRWFAARKAEGIHPWLKFL
jgi:uncharacterized membrane protein